MFSLVRSGFSQPLEVTPKALIIAAALSMPIHFTTHQIVHTIFKSLNMLKCKCEPNPKWVAFATVAFIGGIAAAFKLGGTLVGVIVAILSIKTFINQSAHAMMH